MLVSRSPCAFADTAVLSASAQGNQTLLVPIDSSYPPHFGANTSTDKLAGYVLYNIIPGQFPTHSLHNLQRLYGRLDGVDVAVKVPKVGHAGHIQARVAARPSAGASSLTFSDPDSPPGTGNLR